MAQDYTHRVIRTVRDADNSQIAEYKCSVRSKSAASRKMSTFKQFDGEHTSMGRTVEYRIESL